MRDRLDVCAKCLVPLVSTEQPMGETRSPYDPDVCVFHGPTLVSANPVAWSPYSPMPRRAD